MFFVSTLDVTIEVPVEASLDPLQDRDSFFTFGKATNVTEVTTGCSLVTSLEFILLWYFEIEDLMWLFLSSIMLMYFSFVVFSIFFDAGSRSEFRRVNITYITSNVC